MLVWAEALGGSDYQTGVDRAIGCLNAKQHIIQYLAHS